MPKDTKRAATRRAAKIAKAHATDLPILEVKAPTRRAPVGKRPARGLARYPWAITIISLLIVAGIFAAHAYSIGPFAPPAKAKPKAAAPSPCVASAVVKELTNTAAAPTAAAFAKIQHTYSKAPAMTIDTKKLYCVGLNTSEGLIVLALTPSLAPNTVNNFVYLAQNHFYDGLKFHRVLPNQIIQTGDPKGDGTGGPGYKFNDEPVKGNYTAGCVAMANSGANTNGSQFFICTGDDSKLFAKSYNIFGDVVQGLAIAKKIQGPGDATSTPTPTPTAGIKTDTLNYVTVEAVNP